MSEVVEVPAVNHRALVEARGALKAMADAHYLVPVGMDALEAFRYGVIYQAAMKAEGAVFEALNMLAGYGHDDEAARVIHMREWEEPGR